jgi:hypothetical protein
MEDFVEKKRKKGIVLLRNFWQPQRSKMIEMALGFRNR